MTIQTKATENNVYVVLFTALLEEAFSRYPNKSLNSVDDSCESILRGIDHTLIFGLGLELAYNGGSCGGISLKRDKCYLHLKLRLLTLTSVASDIVHSVQ